MWSEWVSPETIDSRIWTRTAAIAERFWSPREVNQTEDMYRRLAVIDMQLEELGLTHRKNQSMLLRRLASSHDITALQKLVSVIEPVKEYRRYQVRRQTMLSPLTGLIDAAQADAPNARVFNRAVDELVAGRETAENHSKIRKLLDDWRTAEVNLQKTMQSSPALAEAKQLAADFQNLNRIALDALDALNGKQARSAGWRDAQLKTLDEIAKPKAGLEFAYLSGVKKLVVAAVESKNVIL